MNIRKTGEEVFRKALLFSRHRPLLAQLGSLLHREHTHNKRPEQRSASSWSWNHVVGPAVSTVRYYSQDDHFSARSRQPRELQKPSESLSEHQKPNKKEKKNLFFRQLDECSSPSDVLDLVTHNAQTYRRVSNSLSRIWETTKKMSDDYRGYELKLMFEHQGFEELCQGVIIEAPKMRTEDMAYSLLALVRLGVPQRSRVVQILLRVIQENLNHFDERSLSVLAGALELMDPLQNVEALKQGLRLKLENDISLIKNILPLQSVMRAVGKESSDELKRKLEKKALGMANDFTLPNAQYMLASMAIMGLNSRPLLEICCKKIEENVQGIPFSRLMMTLKACQDLHYRNYSLLSSIAEYMATSCAMWKSKQVILLLLEFEKLHFHPTTLMDKFAERVIQNPDALTLKDILSILKVYSQLNHDLGDHKSEFLDGITHAVEAYLDRLHPDNLLKAIYFLSLLEHFPVLPLERLLQEDTLEQLFSNDKQRVLGLEQKLHVVDICLRLDQPALPRPLSVPPILGDLPAPPALPPPLDLFSMLKSLEGVETVEEHLVVEKIYRIDFVINLSSETSHGDKPLQDQHPPRKLAVLCVPSSAYCFGTSHVRGRMAMQTRHLRILGYSPVLVPVQELVLLPEEQRSEMLERLVFPERGEAGVETAATLRSGDE
ncbi:hypothetical protein AALO_G00289850 [Alosa alosa]|uniref:RAP domain-containing protein n=1 Tax=Alosa alosa TaxID=278164 RepID=A0AAV6FGU8_9TELE|nr:FAST kinase domain-containing protein 2, mitochondrial [Alosa alosa]KAG5261900.1 hypothetical protein AALO_G00289850 [Alosa alosa]